MKLGKVFWILLLLKKVAKTEDIFVQNRFTLTFFPNCNNYNLYKTVFEIQCVVNENNHDYYHPPPYPQSYWKRGC